MSRREHKPYHDDDRYMPIVDYSTPRRGEDLTSPNANRQSNASQPADTVIVPSTPTHTTTRVIEDSLFITERIGPVTINSGEFVDVLSLTSEAGDIVSIEVVTDNPYTGVYLEIDDYKNREGTGVTAAELIMQNKITPNNREFYAEDMREDGTFVVKYSPKNPDPYTDRIKLQVRNDVNRPPIPYSHNTTQRLKLRGNLPAPLTLSHTAGSYISHPNFASVTIAEISVLLNKLGKNGYFNTIRNLSTAEDPSIRTGAYTPYMNGMAAAQFRTMSGSEVAGMRIVSAEPGTKVSNTTGVPTPNSVPWPGKSVGGTYTPSQQQFIIYKSNSEDETEAGLLHPSGPTEPLNNGDTIFIKVGDTIYFPGTIPLDEPNAFYDAGTSQFTTAGGYVANTDGAYIVTVSPGLPFKLPKVDMPLADSALAGTNFDGIGTIIYPGSGISEGPMLIHEIVVRRKRRLTQLL